MDGVVINHVKYSFYIFLSAVTLVSIDINI